MKSSQRGPTLHHGDRQFLCVSNAVETKSFLVAKVIFETHQGNSYIFSVLSTDLKPLSAGPSMNQQSLAYVSEGLVNLNEFLSALLLS